MEESMLNLKMLMLQRGADSTLADKATRGINAFAKIARAGKFPLQNSVNVNQPGLSKAFSDATGLPTTTVTIVTGAIANKTPSWLKKHNLTRTSLFGRAVGDARKAISTKDADLIENALWPTVLDGIEKAIEETISHEARIQNGDDHLGPEDTSMSYMCQANVVDPIKITCFLAMAGNEKKLEKYLQLLRYESEVLLLGLKNATSEAPTILAVAA